MPKPERDRRNAAPRKRGLSADRKKKSTLQRCTSIDDMDFDLEGLVARRHTAPNDGGLGIARKLLAETSKKPNENKAARRKSTTALGSDSVRASKVNGGGGGRAPTENKSSKKPDENKATRRKSTTALRSESVRASKVNGGGGRAPTENKSSKKPDENKATRRKATTALRSESVRVSKVNGGGGRAPTAGKKGGKGGGSVLSHTSKDSVGKTPAPPKGLSRRSSEPALDKIGGRRRASHGSEESPIIKNGKLLTGIAPPRGLSRRSSDSNLMMMNKGSSQSASSRHLLTGGDKKSAASTRHAKTSGDDNPSDEESKGKSSSAPNKRGISRRSSEAALTSKKPVRPSRDDNESKSQTSAGRLKSSTNSRSKTGERTKEAKKRKRISKKAIRKRVKKGREFATSVHGRMKNGDDAEGRRRRRSRSRKRRDDENRRRSCSPHSNGGRSGRSGGTGSKQRSKRSNSKRHHKNNTAPGETTSELDSFMSRNNNSQREPSGGSPRESASHRKSLRSILEDCIPNFRKERQDRKFWGLVAVLLFTGVAAGTILLLLRTFVDKGGEDSITTLGDQLKAPSEAPSEGVPLSVGLSFIVDNPGYPSVAPSRVATEQPISTAPTDRPVSRAPITVAPVTPSPTSAPLVLVTMTIAVIVQLDGKPEETGFSLVSSDYSTTYVSREIGSLAGLHNEVVMEVMDIQEQTELIFELTDTSGDGLCCTHGKGYYRVLAGTGSQKKTIISSEQAAKFIFSVGMGHAEQIGGVDPNEYCKPCPDGKDCGRCAWCNADEGFKPEEVYDWQCHSDPVRIPKKCFLGSKRFQLHNRYVTAMAKCTDGFEAWPQMESSPETTVCVEWAKCVKIFDFFEPVCEEELSGSLLVKETCQDKVGGFAFGYSWGFNAPREKECPSTVDFAVSLAPRCCEDQVAFCSTFDEEDENEEASLFFQEKTPPTPMPAGTYAPTVSHAPTWDGYPLTLLIQLDDFSRETGFSITSVDKEITYLERRQGYYKKSQMVVEKVRIPEGVKAILTFTDEGGDGICCENGHGYFQLYSDQGSLILDESGIFSNGVNKTFVVGEPQTLPPTISASPSVSLAPSFNVFPITIAVQLDQWSDETGFSIQSIDGSNTFFDWPAGSFSDQSSDLIFETVLLPRDTEMNLRVTDKGGDGFCCLYGEGYVKIYAGESAEDESALLVFKSAEFESVLSIIFQAGPAPSVSPATTSSPTVSAAKGSSNGLTSSGWCDTRNGKLVDDSCVEVTLVMELDKFSAETSWFIGSEDGRTNFVSRPDGYYAEMQSQKIIETVYLPDDGGKYQFKIVDFMGDGTCCWAGNGWYSLYEGRDIEDESSQLFYGQGDFGRDRVHIFQAGSTPAPTTSPPTHSPQPTVTKYAVEVTIKFDNYSSQTGWYIASDDGDVIISREPGHYSGKDASSIIENIRLEVGNYQFSVTDTNGDGFCCKEGTGYYSLTFNGDILLYEQGRFKSIRTEAFKIRDPSRRNNAWSSSKSATLLRGAIPSSYEPNRQREHVSNEA
eukprot:CAMPEP_0201681074 /NCGR_PEP_ID=MMETSP0494-20130426/50919_1 /ASSEMBLY_ACC=CAM_ASM_000839 /TAXON_ID=420259 /ORGANISM="Thalassiosira gravida, Strain GMp14c1" /LENGTH=1514 /DNA_ID=CAMNT_0048164805 /DNA_START=372 /DNA_END=4916 /DNA_ORIENTATION=-